MADVIQPVPAPPIWPEGQKTFGEWLFSGFQKNEDGSFKLNGLPGYPGQLYPDASQTRLADVWKSWQPYDAGVSYLLDYFANNRGGIGQYSPLSQQMMSWGGAGGPGSNYMENMAQFGTPSNAGLPLNNFALGNPTMSAQYMAPFLMGQIHSEANIPRNSYTPPNIMPRQLQRV